MTFQVTAAMFAAPRYAAIALGCLTVLLNILFLAISLYIYRTPVARLHIDRVSFRLLVLIMAVEMVYSILYVIMYADERMQDKLGEVPAACSSAMTVLLGSRKTIDWLFSCIAVNLMLRICFLYNPIENGLEKVYIGVSFVLGFGIAIVGAGIGMYGGFNGTGCFFAGSTRQEAIISMMVTSWLWQAISTGAAVISISAVFMTLIRRYKVFTTGILGRSLALANSSPEPKSRDKRSSWCPKLLRSQQKDMLIKPEQEFISLAAKISVYPVTLIVTNGITIWGDMFFFASAPTNRGQYVGMVLYYLMYGGRGFLLALVAFFVDPSLRTGLKAARTARRAASAREGKIGMAQQVDKRVLQPWFGGRAEREISHLHPDTHFPSALGSPRPLLGAFVTPPLQVVLAPAPMHFGTADNRDRRRQEGDSDSNETQMTIEEMLSFQDTRPVLSRSAPIGDALYRLPTQL